MRVYSVCFLCLDVSKNRLELAKELGAHPVCVKGLDASEVVDIIKSKLGGSPDITLECSGAEASISNAIKVIYFKQCT